MRQPLAGRWATTPPQPLVAPFSTTAPCHLCPWLCRVWEGDCPPATPGVHITIQRLDMPDGRDGAAWAMGKQITSRSARLQTVAQLRDETRYVGIDVGK